MVLLEEEEEEEGGGWGGSIMCVRGQADRQPVSVTVRVFRQTDPCCPFTVEPRSPAVLGEGSAHGHWLFADG